VKINIDAVVAKTAKKEQWRLFAGLSKGST
jgi:hypothetical protein